MREWHVLLIEYDWRLRRLVRANLEASGIKVSLAVSGQQGVELLRRGLPDLVLVDLDRLDLEASSVFGTLFTWSGGNPPPVIILASEPPDRRWLDSMGASGFLQKPFGAAALLRLVQRVLPHDDTSTPSSGLGQATRRHQLYS